MTCKTCDGAKVVQVPCGSPDHRDPEGCITCDYTSSVLKPCPDCHDPYTAGAKLSDLTRPTFEQILGERLVHCQRMADEAGMDTQTQDRYRERWTELERLRQVLVLHKSRGGKL